MPGIKNIEIFPQEGNTTEFVARWEFAETVNVIASNTGSSGSGSSSGSNVSGGAIVTGSLVTIKPGSTYYNGVAIPSYIMPLRWYVVEVRGDRVVLGKSPDNSAYDIQSPININNLSAVGGTTREVQVAIPTSGSQTIVVKNEKNTFSHYEVQWFYDTGKNIWFSGGSASNEKEEYSLYSPPSYAKRIKVEIKPVSLTHEINGSEVYYWTGSKNNLVYNMSVAPPQVPRATLAVTIDKYTLTAKLENVDDPRTDKIEFQVYRDTSLVSSGLVAVKLAMAAYSCQVSPGGEYRVRCRAVNEVSADNYIYSAWTNYSSPVSSIPDAPASITRLETKSRSVVYMEWASSQTAKSYAVEYTTNADYFDSSNNVSQVTSELTHFTFTDLTLGQEYFFRVKAINENGESGWSPISSLILGKVPSPPTTWSSTTTAVIGEPLNLYWVHNSGDGSSWRYTEFELIINGKLYTDTDLYPDHKNPIANDKLDTDDEYKTPSLSIDTTLPMFKEGSTIKWRVRTSGIMLEFSEWSIERTIDIYSKPTLSTTVFGANKQPIDVITSFPFTLEAMPGPETQTPISYSVAITPNESYETRDYLGNTKRIKSGDVLYSRYFDIDKKLSIPFSAGDIDLENNIEYTITTTVAMNSGLTAENKNTLQVKWNETSYEPSAEIGIDETSVSAYIMPYCADKDGVLIDGVTLGIYRMEIDGTFTEIATGLNNAENVFVTDPHPPLNFARYRIVATTIATGAVGYYDVPNYPVNEKSIIVQWDEKWVNFNNATADRADDISWSGSLLRLPYNIDVNVNYAPEVSLIEYAGRKHPVSYYGTHLGESATWKVDIDADDDETLYALRRLAIWMGDVYVREPSGSGYWASVTVSFGKTHATQTIPVTLNIKRVEGGV